MKRWQNKPTFAQFGLHNELQVLVVVFGVEHTEQRGRGPVLEPEGGEEKRLIPAFVLQASLEQVWQAVWRHQQVVD